MILVLPFNSPLISCPSCSNRAYFSSWRRPSCYCFWSSRVLASSASEGMVNHIHCYASASWPFARSYFHPVEFLSCLDEWFLGPSASCNNPNGCSAFWIKTFHFTAWQLYDCLARIMCYKYAIHASGTGKFSAITWL